MPERLGSPDHVCRIQAFRTLLAFELYRFAFVQSLISGVQNGREMHEHILAC